MTTPYTTTAGNLENDERDSIPEFEAATNAVIENLIDGVHGFAAAADKASDEVSANLKNMGAQRRETVQDMIRIAGDEDMRPITLDDSGTPTGALHRAWIALRDAVEGDDGVIDAAITGEEHAKSEIHNVLENGLPEPLEAVSRRALSQIDSNIAQLRTMKG